MKLCVYRSRSALITLMFQFKTKPVLYYLHSDSIDLQRGLHGAEVSEVGLEQPGSVVQVIAAHHLADAVH